MKLVLFDLDGTLYDARDILPPAYRRGIRALNESTGQSLDVPGESTILDQVGTPADEIFDNLFPELPPDHRALLQREIVSALQAFIRNREGRLMEATHEVLGELNQRTTLALVTNARPSYMNAVVQTHDLGSYFACTYCVEDAPDREKSTLVERVLREQDQTPGKALMVGDRTSDREAARAHGVRFLGCEYGYGKPGETAGEETIASLRDLLEHRWVKTV